MSSSFKIDFTNYDEKNVSNTLKALMTCFNAASAGACSSRKPDAMDLLWEGHALFQDISANPAALPISISATEADYLRLHFMKLIPSPETRWAAYRGTDHMISSVTTQVSDLLDLAVKNGLFRMAP